MSKSTSLMYVVMRGQFLEFYDYSSSFHCKVACMLLDAGVSIDRTNTYGETALIIACSHKDINMIRLLIDHGANIDAQNNYENTILMRAVISGNIEVVKMLLELGVDPLLKNKFGRTALMAICSHHRKKVTIDLDVIRLLIGKNIDYKKQDDRGRATLMQAAYYENIQGVRLLLQLGTNPFVKDKNGKTALQLAKHSSTYHFELVYVSRAKEKQIIEMLKATQRKKKK